MTRTLVALSLGGLMMAAAAPALAQSQPGGGAPLTIQAVTDRPSLNLSAYGEVKVQPDMASITFGVVTEAPTAAEAMRLNAERMSQVMTALRRAGLNERDVQTAGLNLSAQYDYQQNEPPRLRGYQASNRVTVNIYDLTKVGSTADAVVAAGVNQIDGVSFGLRDPKAAENQARQLAVRALQEKAALYAQALGQPLGQIRSLSEGGGYTPRPPMPMYAARAVSMDAGGAETSVSGGELSVRIDITGVYDIGR
ncbi:MAG: SIMPL domain-containing protein [Brevundimonas sp.]|uniref:SIMPL domain-containing protein n=1 Tax=Brevundimonas sp. TaxID=1871086 RepID=UPI00391A0190